MARLLKILLYTLPLILLGGLWWLTTFSKSEAPITPPFLPDRFYATELNSFSKTPVYPSLYAVIGLDKKNIIAVGAKGVILRSDDAGVHFNIVGTPTKERLYSIVRLNDKTLFSVGSNGVILRSDDYGKHFYRVASPVSEDLISITSLNQKELVAVGRGGVIIRSDDGGAHFKLVDSPTKEWLKSIVSIDRQTLIAVGSSGVILRSDDGGTHFRLLESPTKEWLSSLIRLDKRTLLAVGMSGVILKSEDGGESFRLIDSPTKEWLRSITSVGDQTLIAVGEQGLILRSEDAGEHFHKIKSVSKTWLYSITTIGDKTLIAVGEGGVILRSQDGGESFVALGSLSRRYLSSITRLRKQTLVAVGDSGVILRSKGAKVAFERVISPSKANLSCIKTIGKRTIIAVGDRGTILKSKDAAVHFTPISSGTKKNLRSLISLDRRTLFAVGEGGVILKSEDAGEHFFDVASPVREDLYSLTSPDRFTLVAVGSGIILRSEDAGATFKPLDLPTIAYLYSVTSLDHRNLIAVGDSGVILKSIDGGKSFHTISSPTDEPLYYVLSLDRDRVIALGAKGVILKSSDGGESFKLIEFPYSIDLKAALKVGEDLFIVGAYEKIFRMDLQTDRIEPLPYTKRFSNWFWFFGAAVLLYLLFLARLAYIRVGRQPITSELSSDTAIHKISQDRYGTASLVYSLVSLISSPYTKAPLSIAIDAKWGSGKSSVIGMTKTELEELGIKSILFNAWYHQEEKHLLSALMNGMIEHLSPPIFSWENLVFRAHLLMRRVFFRPDSLLLFILSALLLYMAWSVDFELPDYYGEWAKFLSVAAFGFYIFKLTQPFSEATRWFAKKYQSIFSFKKFDKEIGLRDEFLKEINDFISYMGQVVVFIDDLDRCEDDEIFKIMQTINYLASIDSIFIVMAVDKSRVISAIKEHYRSGHSDEREAQRLAEDYLEKIFNITIKIPDTNSRFYKEYCREDQREKRYRQIREHTVTEFIRRVWIQWFGIALLISLMVWNWSNIQPFLKQSAQRLLIIVQHEQGVQGQKSTNIQSSTPSQKKQVAFKDQQALNDPPLEDVESSSAPQTLAIPAYIDQGKWYSHVWVIILISLAGLIAYITILALFRKEQQKEHYAAKIWKIVKSQKSLTPRGENILFNKINFFLSLGQRRYTKNITLGNFLQHMRISIFNAGLFIFCLFIVEVEQRNFFERVKNIFSSAKECAFSSCAEEVKRSDLEIIEGVLKGEQIDDSRFDVIEFT